jgi:ABC1 atypical kinase-like domain
MAELAALQDALPFYPNAVARELIRKELGAYPERVFDWMSTDPVAAASLGQVLLQSQYLLLKLICLTHYVMCLVLRICSQFTTATSWLCLGEYALC